MGPKRFHVQTQPKILDVWHVLTDTNLTCIKITELKEVRFRLQSSMSMLPQHLFTSYRIFEYALTVESSLINISLYLKWQASSSK